MLPWLATMRRLPRDAARMRHSLSHHLLVSLLRLSGRRRRYASAQALQRFIAQRARQAPLGDAPEAVQRAGLQLLHGHDAPTQRPVLRLLPPAAEGEPQRELLYLHGGAYINPIVRQHWQLLTRLVRGAQAAATVPLYPLAPQASHREALDFALRQYRALLARRAPGSLTLMGDSAGGGLALALAQRLRDEGLPQPARLLLISPWVDLQLPEDDAELQALAARDPMLDLPGLREAARLWADGAALHEPALSPVNGRLDGLAPMTVFIGTRDLLWPGVRRLRERAQAQGAALRYVEAPGMLHAWPLLPQAEARQALRQIVQILRGEGAAGTG